MLMVESVIQVPYYAQTALQSVYQQKVRLGSRAYCSIHMQGLPAQCIGAYTRNSHDELHTHTWLEA
jgi:hypothetical protein